MSQLSLEGEWVELYSTPAHSSCFFRECYNSVKTKWVCFWQSFKKPIKDWEIYKLSDQVLLFEGGYADALLFQIWCTVWNAKQILKVNFKKEIVSCSFQICIVLLLFWGNKNYFWAVIRVVHWPQQHEQHFPQKRDIASKNIRSYTFLTDKSIFWII